MLEGSAATKDPGSRKVREGSWHEESSLRQVLRWKEEPCSKERAPHQSPAAFFKKATATKSPARKKTPDTKAPTPKRTPGKVAAKKVVPKRAAAPKKAATPNRATATPKAGALPPQGCYQADERREVNLQLVLHGQS